MSTATAWAWLFAAGVLEILWAAGLKSTGGFTKLWPSAFVIATAAASIYFLSRAASGLPIGVAYAVWTGIGAAGTAIAGFVFFHEPVTLLRVACVSLIILSVAGLKLFS